MKRLVALTMCAVCFGAAAQSALTYPYNPDGNATPSSIWQEHYSSDFSEIDESWSTIESMTVVLDDYGPLLGAPFLANDSVEFSLVGLTGDTLRLTYDLLLFGTWDGTEPPNSINGPDILGCALNDEVFFQATFSNIDTALGWPYSANQSFPDFYVFGDSVAANPAGTGRKEYHPFYTTLDCQNCNVESGQCGGGGLVVYELSFDFSLNSENVTFKWFSDANSSAWCDEFWAIDNVRIETRCTLGCTDPLACNYDSQATCHKDCIFPVVGQDCQGGEFLCGEGTIWDSQTQMCLPEAECDSLYNPDVDFDDYIGLTDILAILSHYNNEWPPWQCGETLEYQGYDYETVQIGEQCWFAENLRAENYRNGDVIPNDLNNNQWIDATEGALSVYGNGDLNLSIYGRLYNWFAATDERALCPNGWHVPADSEWTALTDGLGGDSIAGEKIKAIDGWNGTNSSGFSGLPGGNRRDSDGNFYFIEHNAFWWSTTIVNDKSVDRSLGNHTAVIRSETSPQYGHSVRCIKNTE